MPRTKGATNAGFAERRLALAERLRARLSDGTLPTASLRELAASAGVGVATLRHYFGDRTKLVQAVMALHAPGASRHLAYLRTAGDSFEASIASAIAYISLGLKQPVVAELHRLGLAEGLGRHDIGRIYLSEILEPMIEALEARLATHVARGEMRDADLRVAALALISPIVLAHLHQSGLGGSETRPLDDTSFLAEFGDAFVRSYRP